MRKMVLDRHPEKLDNFFDKTMMRDKKHYFLYIALVI